MVNQDNTKLGVGAVAVAGTLLAAYVLYKQWWKRREDKDADLNGDSLGSSWSEVRRRNGRGRNGRNVSDPGRMFYSTDRVMPVPSDTAKEGIYKRHSSGARLSQIPKPVGMKASEERKELPSPEGEHTKGSRFPEPDVIPVTDKQAQKVAKDERYEDAVEKKKSKRKSDEVPADLLSASSIPSLSTSPSKSPEKPEKPSDASTKEPVQKPDVVKAVKEDQSQQPDHSSPSKSAEGPTNEGGAGEAMAVPVDPHLLEDQSAMMIGDSEGSDIGAGDTLAEDDQFVSKGGITLSSASSVESSPAKSPLKTVESHQQETVSSDSAKSESQSSDPVRQYSSSKSETSEPLVVQETQSEPSGMKLDPEVITRAILQVQKSPNSLDKKVIKVLVDLLKVKEEKLLHTALESIVRCAAFSANQKVLREDGCPEELCRLLQVHSETVLSGTAKADNILVSVNNAIMNLSMDVANQAKLQTCIPVLIDLVLHEGLSSNVKLSSLQPLTNLSTTSSYHGQYTRAIQQLYDLMDTGNRVIRIQSLKLLVNLSCNSDMVRHLLAARAPTCMMALLEKTADPHLSLRLVTLLANVATTVQKEEVTSSSLPPDDKAASPETMYSAIFGVNNLSQIRSKVFPLTRHDSEDISQQAAKLYSSLPNC